MDYHFDGKKATIGESQLFVIDATIVERDRTSCACKPDDAADSQKIYVHFDALDGYFDPKIGEKLTLFCLKTRPDKEYMHLVAVYKHLWTKSLKWVKYSYSPFSNSYVKTFNYISEIYPVPRNQADEFFGYGCLLAIVFVFLGLKWHSLLIMPFIAFFMGFVFSKIAKRNHEKKEGEVMAQHYAFKHAVERAVYAILEQKYGARLDAPLCLARDLIQIIRQ